MRVAVVPFEFPVLSETFVINIATGLLDRGHDVDILPLYGAREKLSAVHPAVKKYDLLRRTFYPPRIVLNNKAMYAPLALRELSLLMHKPYDIIHFQFGETALKCLPLRRSRIFGGKWVVSFRGYDISSYVRKYGDNIYKTLFQKADLFLSNSDFFRRRLINLGSDDRRTFVCRSGIDCSKFVYSVKAIPKGKRVRIITVGRLVEKKGIEYSVRAVADLLKQKMDVEYEIIGDGPLRNSLQGLINGFGAGDRIKLMGSQNQEFIIEALQRSHVFITSSVTAEDGDQNGPDNTIKEAMAVGLPVIASRSGAIEEVVEDGKTGFLTDERDVQGIVQKVKHLMDHPETWPVMTAAARKFVEENYNLEKLNDELVARYQMVLN